ncbi:uncharacterized protein LOC141818510 [Curcuma longa]|uniref:uncharacterized protein LOC141818510 n=1 Tax=Curcuma longa TaxID=136217 RepID=UPI003D9F521D
MESFPSELSAALSSGSPSSVVWASVSWETPESGSGVSLGSGSKGVGSGERETAGGGGGGGGSEGLIFTTSATSSGFSSTCQGSPWWCLWSESFHIRRMMRLMTTSRYGGARQEQSEAERRGRAEDRAAAAGGTASLTAERIPRRKKTILDEQNELKLINEDLGTQLSIAKIELKEAYQKFSSLEVELEEKSNCYEELEAACLELQLQIESVASKEAPKYVLQQEEKQIQADCDIAAASEKLAVCQETIVNLGKQLKALASPQDVPLFDKVISTPATAKSKHRLQLVDHMREEDQVTLQSPNTKEIIRTEPPKQPTAAASKNQHSHEGSAKSIMNMSPVKSPSSNNAERLMIVPNKQKGGGMFLRKLLLQRKRERQEP